MPDRDVVNDTQKAESYDETVSRSVAATIYALRASSPCRGSIQRRTLFAFFCLHQRRLSGRIDRRQHARQYPGCSRECVFRELLKKTSANCENKRSDHASARHRRRPISVAEPADATPSTSADPERPTMANVWNSGVKKQQRPGRGVTTITVGGAMPCSASVIY